MTTTTRRALAVAAYAVAFLGWCWLVGIPNDPTGVALWLWLLAIAWRLDWSWQFPRDWWPWLVALALYGLLRGGADELGFGPHEAWPVQADQWLAHLWGGHSVPTVALQRDLCVVPCVDEGPLRWYDYLASVTYASHFLAGLTIAGILWIRDRGEFVRWIRRYVTISYLALVGYYVFPMAPPWMASQDGLLPPVTRMSGRAFHQLGIERTTMVFGSLADKVAAMPSLHCGFTYLIALYAITRLRTPWRWLLLLYPLAMTFTLVYTAEHYLVDTLFGGAVAVLSLLIGAAWDRWRPPEQVVSGTSPARRRSPEATGTPA